MIQTKDTKMPRERAGEGVCRTLVEAIEAMAYDTNCQP
jgi:hypothetical protein